MTRTIHTSARIVFAANGPEASPPPHAGPRELLALLRTRAGEGGSVLLRGLEIDPGVMLTSALVAKGEAQGVVVVFGMTSGVVRCRFDDADGGLIDRVPGGLATWRSDTLCDDLSWANGERAAPLTEVDQIEEAKRRG